MDKCLEDQVLKHLYENFQQLYHLPSESTITKKINEKYQVVKERFGSMLSSVESICLTADIWTHTSTMKSYLGVTAHFTVGTEFIFTDLCAKPLTVGISLG
ncbi:uncharacterized protein LOC127278973 isoform X2 [Leptopilina boulardi]|nr:uncharacterized protein LOC127278973 isoform X2 [Leptopilina boulardi]